MVDKKLTVNDILVTPHFEHSLVIAGKKGLSKSVDWVHIIDTTHSGEYVNGGELVLTTGAGWKDKDDPLIFINQLIEKNVTALCIQIGERFNNYKSVNDIPGKMVQAADLNDFPLIVFPEDYDCRFVDLIHDLHTMIINENYKNYIDQEQFIQELYLILLNPHEIKDILFFLHRYLDVNVVYYPKDDKVIFAPRVSNAKQKLINGLVENMICNSISSLSHDKFFIASKTVNICQKDFARLAIYSEKRQLNSYDYLILEKCTIGLAQEYFGNIYIQESERQEKEAWVEKWLTGRLSTQEITQKIQEADPSIEASGCAVCLINLSSNNLKQKMPRENLMKIIGVARQFIEQNGFYLFSCIDQQSIILVLANKLEIQSWRSRLSNALEQINGILSINNLRNLNDEASFSVGKIYPILDQLTLSLQNAKDTFFIQHKLDKPIILFYEDLHIYRIIIALDKIGILEDFIKDYLQPIIGANSEPDTVLLGTLLALRDCQYSKIEAAKKLFISRQSLYQRISTLEKRFGKDFFTDSQKRICLEIALYGMAYIKNIE